MKKFWVETPYGENYLKLGSAYQPHRCQERLRNPPAGVNIRFNVTHSYRYYANKNPLADSTLSFFKEYRFEIICIVIKGLMTVLNIVNVHFAI
jgi:hypothetical protein